jgi:hypothetical protein
MNDAGKRLIAFFFFCLFVFSGCVAPRSQEFKSFNDVVFKYENKLLPNKALVVAYDSPQKWVAGVSGNKLTIIDAYDIAYDECAKNRKIEEITAPCVYFAYNNNFFYDRSNPDCKVATREMDNSTVDYGKNQGIYGEEEMKKKQVFNDYLEALIYSLINDALDLIPGNYRNAMVGDEDIDEIMEGAINYDFSIPLNYSISPENFGAQAAYIAIMVYGKEPTEEIKIPEAIYYKGFIPLKDIEEQISEGKEQLRKSEVLYRDQYNLALNLVVNIWIETLRSSGRAIKNRPKEGVYIRNSDNNLYPYDVWDDK